MMVVKLYLIPILNQSAIFVGSVVDFLNGFVRNGRDRSLRASSLPPRYHLWFRNGIRDVVLKAANY